MGDQAEFERALGKIRAQHDLPDRELKSKDLKTKLAPVVLSILRFLNGQRWPVFVEAVDKRSFLAIHVVDRLLCGELDGGYVDMPSRNMMAELLADQNASLVFDAYVAACHARTAEAVSAAIDALWDWLETRDEDIARTTQFLTMFARDRVRKADADPTRFLPLADSGPGGKPVWMLPNLQSLTNIYARINQWSERSVEGLELVHDQQLQYGSVLVEAKESLERLAKAITPPSTPFADYRLAGAASFRFATSESEPAIQAADVIAGFVMRYARAYRGGGKVPPDQRDTLLELLGSCDPIRATGVNFVMTTRDLNRMDVPVLAPHLDGSWPLGWLGS